MIKSFNEITKKKILIYGFGKSGYSSFKYLHKNNKCHIFDDNKKKVNQKFKKFFITKSKLIVDNFDHIILSPGIDINNCILSSYLKKNRKKINTDLDIFYKVNPKTLTITITGTNGKSTTCKLLFNILKKHGFDARLTGNIGNPILNEKNITKQSIFVIEASSYQLAYSQYFRSKYSLIINIFPDHLDRHRSMTNYINSKLKSVTKQNKNDTSILPDNFLLKKILKKKKINSKIIFLNKNKYSYIKTKIKNNYFKKSINFQNLTFLLELSKYFNFDRKIIFKTIDNFKPLKYRQELIHDSRFLKIINDSKSTTLSSTTPFLKTNEKTYWILGGIFKKGDQFNLNKKYYKKIEAFIYGKDKEIFSKILKNKIKVNLLNDLNSILKLISKIKKKKSKIKILFSPAAASFDQFKNFEHRGKFFNKLIKKYLLN